MAVREHAVLSSNGEPSGVLWSMEVGGVKNGNEEMEGGREEAERCCVNGW